MTVIKSYQSTGVADDQLLSALCMNRATNIYMYYIINTYEYIYLYIGWEGYIFGVNSSMCMQWQTGLVKKFEGLNLLPCPGQPFRESSLQRDRLVCMFQMSHHMNKQTGSLVYLSQ